MTLHLQKSGRTGRLAKVTIDDWVASCFGVRAMKSASEISSLSLSDLIMGTQSQWTQLKAQPAIRLTVQANSSLTLIGTIRRDSGSKGWTVWSLKL
ncbi:uncharacterized protein N7511_002076 [Penicillium nucicola]|uniref:uncharacterized protein n=1 Tax=Penicillium nucicola TaxID=1850975 RepID=UPI002544FEDC|nr:uncharacterized protein N7511_002076 [Penicillium nucicola]KAJ5770025.1 hypothetical protein N7511_002076 [Penicillium nucicola]